MLRCLSKGDTLLTLVELTKNLINNIFCLQALKLSVTALGETAPGKIVNLVANDVNRFDLVSVFIHHMWSAPLSALIIGYILYTEAGLAGVIGIAAVFIVVPIQCESLKNNTHFTGNV